jgi:Domain of unknown function (DUF4160)
VLTEPVRLSSSKGDASELQNFLAWADVYFYVEDHPGRRRYLLTRRDRLRIRMYKETQHVRPHIHIDYGKERHVASYALDTGERLAGDLDRRYDKAISAWIAKSQERLFNIWTAIQSSIDPEILIAELQGDDW